MLLSGSLLCLLLRWILFLTLRKCSPNLLLIWHNVSPIYRILHLVQEMQYTTHEEEQVKLDLTVNDLFPLEMTVDELMWLKV